MGDRIDSYSSRKFLLTMLSFTVGSLFCIFHLISGAEWVTVCSIATGMYKIANVASQFVPTEQTVITTSKPDLSLHA
jgi:hypothetical protein